MGSDPARLQGGASSVGVGLLSMGWRNRSGRIHRQQVPSSLPVGRVIAVVWSMDRTPL